MGMLFEPTHLYVGDKAARAYESVYVGQPCVRVGAWRNGKAVMQFADGRDVVCLVGNKRMLRLPRPVCYQQGDLFG